MLQSMFRTAVVLDADQGRKLWVMGYPYVIKVSGDETDGQFALVDITAGPNSGTPLHIHHAEDEMFYILRGAMTFHADGEETVAGPGSFVYIPRGMVHGWWNRSDAEVQMLSAVTPAGFEQFFVAIGTPADAAHPTPPPVDPAAVAKIGQMAPHYNMEVISGW